MTTQKNILLLGCGLVGSAIAEDLAQESDLSVTVTDRDKEALSKLQKRSPEAKTQQSDVFELLDNQKFLQNQDLIINAVPGEIGFRALQKSISSGKNIVDIAFSPEDFSALNQQAKEQGSTAIVDCGVAPGMSNFFIGQSTADFDAVDEAKIYVGGLPEERDGVFDYRAVFSPSDVVEEYTRTSRIRINGEMVEREALSEPEDLAFDGIGTLEAFYTDGLRSLLYTTAIPTLIEKTLRYPGHRQMMYTMREAGFFSEEKLESGVSPRDITLSLFRKAWKLQEDEKEFTVLRVEATGQKNEKPAHRQYTMVDRTDEQTGVTSMARTTGYMATTAVRYMLSGAELQSGIIFPEQLGTNPQCFEFFQNELQKKNITWQVEEK